MAETDMVERVAKAILAESQTMGALTFKLGGDQSVEYRLARAAIETIFKGSSFIEFGGMTVVANPDFPAQYWDGEQMREVIDAALSPPSGKE